MDDGALMHLMRSETTHNCDLEEVPSMWLVNDILPAINLEVLNRDCWNRCLVAAIYSPGHAMLPQILQHCDASMARQGIQTWLRCSIDWPYSRQDSGCGFNDFRMLVALSGGLCFDYDVCRVDDYGRPVYFHTSPVLMAIRYSWAFSTFRAAVQTTGIKVEELIRSQIELLSDGWTFERLVSLFHDHSELIKNGGGLLWSTKTYQLCNNWFWGPDEDEVSWKRRVNRIKAGMDLGAPLNEEEESEREELEVYLIDFHNGICRKCHEKNKKKKSRWTLLR